ncbi:UDP-n-acetylglucosamine pyrophosphorylase [Fasciolopsis buskii]|uniref:UDP-N-acetylglucosamine diphosphorylase n=1 Tax=Fasciolopsis buskii TaxID=27845 RepID=A0A8E0VLN1_9TREM|nr:UDP-n-acetylglucosamine pyrophosphorylase [Fasciolopsis buski]
MPAGVHPYALASACGQGHLFKFWESLTETERKSLLSDVESIDFDKVVQLFQGSQKQTKNNIEERLLPPEDNICGCQSELRRSNPALLDGYYQAALKAVHEGKVAVLLLAGGQGTRLGVSYPKGLYKPGLPSGRSLYQIQAEQIRRVLHLAAQKFGSLSRIPWYIMTSEHTQDTTIAYFQSHNFFGHDPNDIIFFEQSNLPALDFNGKIFLASKSRISLSPDGNGGLYKALRDGHILEHMKSRGVEYVQTYCVDNILVKLPDLHFIGFCMDRDVECGAQVVQKINPKEPIGVLGMVSGRYQVVEYSEISPETAALRRINGSSNQTTHSPTDAISPEYTNGRLVYSHGNICVHFFTRQFLDRVIEPNVLSQMKHHVAKKKVTHLDLVTCQLVTPSEPNGIKFEKFIFDVFPLAERFAIWEVPRKERFSPLKNGPDAKIDCPLTSRTDYLSYHAMLARNAGALLADDSSLNFHSVDRESGADTKALIEISPLVTYDGENLECLAGVKLHGVHVLELDDQTGKPILLTVDRTDGKS